MKQRLTGRRNRFLICLLAALTLAVSMPFAAMAEPGYESTLFDTARVHRIDIRIAAEDWEELLADPVSKSKYHADIVIDGEELKDVSFAAKGNSSLYFVAADQESARYSFRVIFGKFVEGQTYHGLDRLSLNNGFSDATFLRDHLCYELFRQAGVPAPLTSYVWVTVNGEDQGLYCAVEDEKESFLNREFAGEGVIYKPESKDTNLSLDRVEEIKNNGLPMETVQGADLVYTDDDPESYPDIFENAETKATEQDTRDVIAALRNLSEGKDLEECLDTEEIIRFFAAHNLVLNYDSYTGSFAHNLVLHVNQGRLSLLPWDYNLAFGAFVPVVGKGVLDDATDILNQGIDSPLIGISEECRPMWKWIAEDERYLQKYHEVLDELLTEYFESGQFDRELTKMTELLLPCLEKDPTAFYSAEQFQTACEVLRQFCSLRAQSIRLQLEGELAAVNEDQEDAAKVDASALRLVDMGTSSTR